MKRGVLILVWALTIVLVMGLAGCRRLGRKAMEGAIEDALGGSIDISDDGATISTDDGMLSSGDDMEWPAEAMGNLPVPNGKITFVMKGADDTYCAVEISDWDKDEAIAYHDALQKMGYTDGFQSTDEEGISFNCTGEDGSSVMFTYSFSSNNGSISYSAAQPDDGGN